MLRLNGLKALSAAMVIGLCLGAQGDARAALVTVYSSAAAWNAAVSGTVFVEDFADSALQPGLTLRFGANSPTGSISGGVYNDTAVTQFNDTKNPLLSFTSTTAFGADFDLSPGGPGAGLLLALSFLDGTSASQFIANPAGGAFNGFFGLVSDTKITSVRFDSNFTGVEAFSADNLRFLTSGSNPVPEPGSLALVGLALITAMAVCRRSR